MCDFCYEADAVRGAPLPEGLDMVDACCYMALRGLYVMFQLGMMAREEAVAEKHWEIIKATEAARSRLRLEPTVQHGYELCAAIDGAKRRREAMG